MDIIKGCEGLSLKVYLCPANVPTIGYGHVVRDSEKSLYVGGVTKEKAEEILEDDVSYFEREVKDLVDYDINENQFSALVSFSFNVGVNAFRNSTLRRKLLVGDYDGAANEFKRWNLGGGKILNGLIERRKKEEKLFKTQDLVGDYNYMMDVLEGAQDNERIC